MPVFALGRSANVYVIYKDEITTEAVQSPLFSYVTFAKVVKITGITLQIIEILPCYHNRAGHKHLKLHKTHTPTGGLCSIEDYMTR
ncbi:hypothetical protein GAN87_22210 [Bacteroides thetaiotaomicron]|nr:hypothetical protein GAN87_22210 [Bacteroides thetaiotaomicron]